MKAVVFQGLDATVLDDTSCVVVLSGAGTPLAVVKQFANNPPAFIVKHFQEPGFEQVLAGLGLDRVLVESANKDQ
jgi:hypothetical protein